MIAQSVPVLSKGTLHKGPWLNWFCAWSLMDEEKTKWSLWCAKFALLMVIWSHIYDMPWSSSFNNPLVENLIIVICVSVYFINSWLWCFKTCLGLTQDDWNPDWQSTSSSKVTYLVHRLKELQETNRKIGYPCEKREVTSNESKFFSNRSYFNIPLEACHISRNEWSHIPLEKVIIFSQFLEHIHVIEQQVTKHTHDPLGFVSSIDELMFSEIFSQLSIAGVQFAGLYSPMHSSNKVCSCLLLFSVIQWFHTFDAT